jgi:hypothetical protein
MLHYKSQISAQRNSKSQIFSHYFSKFSKITTATPAISMRSPKPTARLRQNHRESYGSWASVTGLGLSIPHFPFGKDPFAGVVLLSGVGAKPPPDGV